MKLSPEGNVVLRIDECSRTSSGICLQLLGKENPAISRHPAEICLELSEPAWFYVSDRVTAILTLDSMLPDLSLLLMLGNEQKTSFGVYRSLAAFSLVSFPQQLTHLDVCLRAVTQVNGFEQA